MILVGQYNSPYVRRVAVSLRVLGFAYEHDTRSVFSDFDAMRALNPLGRIPALVLDDGEVLIDSAAILDWLDQTAGPERALIPPGGAERRQALRNDRARDRRDRQDRRRHLRAPDPARRAALARMDRPLPHPGQRRHRRACREPWPAAAKLDQAQITTACMLRYVQMANSSLLPAGRFRSLEALSARCESLPAFQATYPIAYVLPRGAPDGPGDPG